MLEELHKWWEYQAAHLRELYRRKECGNQQNDKNDVKLKIGQPVMVRDHAHHTSKPKHLLDYMVLKTM